MFIVDAHLDLAYNVDRGRDPLRPAIEQPIVDNEIATVGLPDLHAGGVGLICATIFCSPRRYKTAEEARAVALNQLDWYRKQIDAERLRMVKNRGDLPRSMGVSPMPSTPTKATEKPEMHGRGAHATSALPIILLLEGADSLRSVDDVTEWFDAGLRMVGLAWRHTRAAGGTDEPGPLTDFGRDLIRAFDRVGIIHDTSHLAEESFWQLMDLATGPVLASHSNCRALVPTDRQLSDDMIKAIAARDGVIGINFYDQFLMLPSVYRTRRCTLADMIQHIQHMADLLGTTKHVGLGTDMDGGLGRDEIPCEITTAADLPRVADGLAAAGFGDDDVRGIMSENWLRFFQRSLPA
jgi:membrane dipeptidase